MLAHGTRSATPGYLLLFPAVRAAMICVGPKRYSDPKRGISRGARHTVVDMIFRFSLYGFLKNQRYFEPFLVLALLQMGLSFFEIGLLLGFRELAVNIMEIPSGAIADLYGRRKSMILSFAAYILGFLTLGFAHQVPVLFVAMFMLAIGDAFRTGTHKAMIFTWLRIQGRTEERTQIYGYTRSWSKIGSAVSAIAAAAFVLAADSYTLIFFFAVVPYALNIVNFLGYPVELEGEPTTSPRPTQLLQHTNRTLVEAVRRPGVRRLIIESMGFEGVFRSVKDYLQPVLALAAIAVASRYSFSDNLSEIQQSALLIGPIYLALHLLSSVASRNTHRIARRAGGETYVARWFWLVSAAIFAVIFLAGFTNLSVILISAFFALYVLQDAWRPVLISRFDEHSSEKQGATILSIESQSRRFATMLLAPLMGFAIDTAQSHSIGAGAFWPIGVIGLLVGLGFFATSFRPTPVTDKATTEAASELT
jgi:MFS family permease